MQLRGAHSGKDLELQGAQSQVAGDAGDADGRVWGCRPGTLSCSQMPPKAGQQRLANCRSHSRPEPPGPWNDMCTPAGPPPWGSQGPGNSHAPIPMGPRHTASRAAVVVKSVQFRQQSVLPGCGGQASQGTEAPGKVPSSPPQLPAPLARGHVAPWCLPFHSCKDLLGQGHLNAGGPHLQLQPITPAEALFPNKPLF